MKKSVNRFLWVLATFWAAVLAYLVLSALSAKRGPHPRVYVKAEVKTIEVALRQYYAEYHSWPVPTNHPEDQIDNAPLMDILCARTNSASCQTWNPKRYRMFEPRRPGPNGECLDHWGNPYHIIVDVTFDGVISVGDATVRKEVVVWSDGKNKKNEWGQGDDITSWK